MANLLEALIKRLPHVGEIRQVGLIVGVDLWADPAARTPFPWESQTGNRVCQAARAHGLLTRPIRDTLVLMPPYCTTKQELACMVEALRQGILETM